MRFRVRWLADYSSLLVLIGLMGYYSLTSLREQRPITPAAARQVARAIVTADGHAARILIITGESRQDRVFARALQDELASAGANVLAVISGPASAARHQLDAIGEQGLGLDAVATHRDIADSYPFLRPEGLGQLVERYPSLANTRIYKPASYVWPSFLTRQNLLNVLNHNAGIAIIAIGMTMVIITGGIDLSVGSLLALSGVVVAIVIQRVGGAWGVAAGCLAGLGVCAASGAITGAVVTTFRVPAFIVTLSMMMVASGLAFISAVRYHATRTAGGTAGTPEAIHIDVAWFGRFANGELIGIPVPVWLLLGLYGVAHLVMTRTVFGRHIYAVGGNAEAARLSGISIRATLLRVYVLSALSAAMAGIIDASRFVGGRPNAGELYELKVIAAVVVGGTSLFGGQGRITGTLVGVLIIAVIENGMNIARVASYEQKVVFGLLILAASLLDQLKRRGTAVH